MNIAPHKVIAAIRDRESLQKALESPVSTVFLLYGTISSLEEQSQLLHQHRKLFFLHVDMLDGLKGDASGLQYIARTFRPTGIISTKGHCLKLASELGLQTILRIFLIDSLALKTGALHCASGRPNYVEVLPGVSEKIIALAGNRLQLPIIAGGLISDEADVISALAAGATAVSTSKPQLWRMPLPTETDHAH